MLEQRAEFVATKARQRVAFAQQRPQLPRHLPEKLVALDSPEGQRLLASSLRADLEPLLAHFVPQEYGSYCGVASSVAVLNALGPEALTQDGLFAGMYFAIDTTAAPKSRSMFSSVSCVSW